MPPARGAEPGRVAADPALTPPVAWGHLPGHVLAQVVEEVEEARAEDALRNHPSAPAVC